MASDLYLHQVFLDSVELIRLSQRLRLPRGTLDLGYLVHCQLAQWFPGHAPKPFAIPHQHRNPTSADWGKELGPTPPKLEVLAYSTDARTQLEQYAQLYAKPEAMKEFESSGWVDKKMPSLWEKGMRLGFEVRVCPVTRRSNRSAPPVLGGPKQPHERDVFLTRVDSPDAPPVGTLDRRAVYASWLEKQLIEQGGVDQVNCRMEGFHLARLVRRTQGGERSAPALTLPDALLQGTFQVADAEKFQALLTRGIGRHRSFGFGMLLRPPRG